jgi:hypothetical protein
MLCILGAGAGSPGGASTCSPTHHDRRVRPDCATGFHHRPTDADYDQGCRTRRNADAARLNYSRATANGTGTTGKSEYADGAVSDVTSDANCAERNRDRYNSLGHNRRSAQPVADFGAGRTTIKFPGHPVKQSRNESACHLGEHFFDGQFQCDYAE